MKPRTDAPQPNHMTYQDIWLVKSMLIVCLNRLETLCTCMEALGLRPRSSLHVDTSQRKDVSGWSNWLAHCDCFLSEDWSLLVVTHSRMLANSIIHMSSWESFLSGCLVHPWKSNHTSSLPGKASSLVVWCIHENPIIQVVFLGKLPLWLSGASMKIRSYK